MHNRKLVDVCIYLDIYCFVSFIKVKAGKIDGKALQDERGSERVADRASETHAPASFGRFHCGYYKDGDGGG